MTRKVALITGASGGIGEAIAIELSKNCDIIVHYASNEAGAKQVLAQLAPGNHDLIQCDVANEQAVIDMMQHIAQTYGKIDILVNNAGITKDNLLLRMKEEEFQDVIDINLLGTYHCIRHVARIMMKQKQGVIINMASVVGISGNLGQVNYAASKGGVIAMSKACAKELASRNVRVNVVAPGFIDTKMTQGIPDAQKQQALAQIPLQRFGKATDVAHCVAFLCSDKSSYMTGQVICVDGGMVM